MATRAQRKRKARRQKAATKARATYWQAIAAGLGGEEADRREQALGRRAGARWGGVY